VNSEEGKVRFMQVRDRRREKGFDRKAPHNGTSF
jgi:hypothetical protein